MEAALSESFESLSLGFPEIKKKQKEALFAVLQGKDVRLPTGYWKTIITAVFPKAFDTLHRQLKKHSIAICI